MAFRQKLEISSKLTSTNPKLNVAVRKDAMSLATALKTANQLYSASGMDSQFKGVLASLAGKLNVQLEKIIVKELGGGQIQSGKGGFFPDYFIELKDEQGQGTGVFEAREQKLSSIEEIGSGDDATLYRKKQVSLAGGSGIILAPGVQDLSEGFNLSSSGAEELKSGKYNTSRFITQLKKAKGKPKEILKVLNGAGKSAKVIKRGLALKANYIDIPVVFQGKVQNRTIKFTWKEIEKSVDEGKMRLTVEDIGEGRIKLNLYFTGSLITKMLNEVDKKMIYEFSSKTGIGGKILEALSEVSALPTKETQLTLQKWLKEQGFELALKYVKGSAKIGAGIIQAPKKTKQKAIGSARQSFISGVQLSALVQKRLEATMDKVGNPNPPQLKYRSGRFVSSVQVFPNYKRGLMKYAFNPIYRSLEDYGYTPDSQVITSIRQVVTSLYSRQFNIVRAV